MHLQGEDDLDLVISYVLEAEFTPENYEDSTKETFDPGECRFHREPKPRILSTFRTAIGISIFNPVILISPKLFQLGL